MNFEAGARMRLFSRLRRTVAHLFVIAILAAIASAGSLKANEAAAALEIKEENYIVNPAGETVVMIFDLFTFQDRLKAVPSAERAAAAKVLSTRVMDHYLATLPKSEAAGLKSATVALVYIPKRNEYKNPDLSSLQQLGLAKVVIKDGKSASDGEVTGALQF
jgi:hypothetical protein